MNEKTVKQRFIHNPETARELASRADWKFERDDFKGAIEEFTLAIELDPHNSELYVDRAFAKRSTNDYHGAIEDYTKALELDHNGDRLSYMRYFVYRERGYVKHAVGDYQGAIEDLNLCIDSGYFAHSMTYYTRGEAKCEFGDQEGACQDWRKTLVALKNEKSRHQYLKDYDETLYDDFSKKVISLIDESTA